MKYVHPRSFILGWPVIKREASSYPAAGDKGEEGSHTVSASGTK